MPKKKKRKKSEKSEIFDPSLSTKKLFLLYKKTKNPQIREELIMRHLKLVVSLAKKFGKNEEVLADLIQVGNLGLINAIDRYDPERGVEFISYATPTIVGEIKRYFRDKLRIVKVPRYLQELNKKVNKAIDFLSQKLERSPAISEIADYLNVSEEEVLESLELGRVYNPISLYKEIITSSEESPSIYYNIAEDIDTELEMVGEKTDLEKALESLPERERKIIEYRFYKNMSQIEIAKEMKISQMQVSRLQNLAILKLRKILSGNIPKTENKPK